MLPGYLVPRLVRKKPAHRRRHCSSDCRKIRTPLPHLPPATMPTRSENFLLVLKTGRTLPHLANLYGDFEHWLSTGLRAGCTLPIEVLEAQHASTTPQAWPDPRRLAGVVISGSRHGHRRSSLDTTHGALAARRLPCGRSGSGHLLRSPTAGTGAGWPGGNHPRGLELGTVAIETRTAATRTRSGGTCPAPSMPTPSLPSVLQLPPGATLLAGNAHDHHHAYRWQDNVWGVRFTPNSMCIMQGYIDHLRPNLPPESIRRPRRAARHRQRPACCPASRAMHRTGRDARKRWSPDSACRSRRDRSIVEGQTPSQWCLTLSITCVRQSTPGWLLSRRP